MSAISISITAGREISIRCPAMDLRAKQAPVANFDRRRQIWLLPLDDVTLAYIERQYSNKHFSSEIASMILNRTQERKSGFPADNHKFSFPPMEKQWPALDLAWNEPNAALFLAMGGGKTFVAINVATALAARGMISGLLVICPTPVKPVWEIELEKHCTTNYACHVLESGKKKSAELFIDTPVNALKVFIVGVEALSQGGAFATALEFAAKHKTMAVVDESHNIKTPTAGRTDRATELGYACKRRVILTGTPITQGMQDLYSQYRFLDWKIIGQKSYFTFKARYCVSGGFEGKKIIGYTNQDELLDLVSPHTLIVTKEEMMDLPPKVYQSMIVEPSTAQAKALKELGDPFLQATEYEGKEIEVETVLERMTRYQQIVGGHFPFKEDDDSGVIRLKGKNAKLDAMLGHIDCMDETVQVIIWARFTAEIEWIKEELDKKYGENTVATYYGATPQGERRQVLEDFQAGKTRFFLSSPQVGGAGITLTAATYTIYFSNTFSLAHRLQSEDRNHRKGTTSSVTYMDLIMNHAIDRSMVAALKAKKEISDYVTEEIIERQTRGKR